MSFLNLTDELEKGNFSKIEKLQLCLMNPDEIRKGSVCEILYPDTYEGDEPKPNGLFDLRMGTVDKNGICATCYCSNDLCPGHFGRIELAEPVYNINYIDFVKKTMKCVCIRCSNILVNKSDEKIQRKLKGKSNKQRFEIIYNESQKIKKCQYNSPCYALQPNKYEKFQGGKLPSNDDVLAIYADMNQEVIKNSEGNKFTKVRISPLQCYTILKRINNVNSSFLGFDPTFSRPEWMILTVLPMPPPSVRPPAITNNDLKSEDDLTHILAGLVKANNFLKQKIDENCEKKIIDTHHGLLQLYTTCLINNEISGIGPLQQRSQRKMKGLVQRLKQKEGRIRHNLMGKRVDYSARTVISVDPNINIDEFGIPLSVAMNLTFPEMVTKFNINKMKKLLLNGPNKYPGVKRIKKKEIKNDGSEGYAEYSLKYRDPASITLEIGDVLYRHLVDGDIALFNRQPTLHRMSMMAHKVRILPMKTFRLNVTVTTPYNADFDGDEMNMHVPQSYTSKIELEKIALVPKNIITPGKCKPVIKIVQDTLVGSFSFTMFDLKFKKEEVMNLFAYNDKFILGKPSSVENDIEHWTSKDIISMILPSISLKTKNSSDNFFFIEDGILKDGALDKKILGSTSGGLIQLIYNTYDSKRCQVFLDDIQRIITRWFENFSLSFSVGDILPNNKKISDMDENKIIGIDKVNKILLQVSKGIYHPNLDKKYLKIKIETDIRQSLRGIEDYCTKVVSSDLDPMNNINRLVVSGSKGSTLNMRQISGIVGQQDISGHRVEFKWTDRTLPHYFKYDYSASACGFCKNSFLEGLSPQETFFHAMGGRMGVIDTAVKTAGVGYVSRRLIKATEDIKVMYDLTVRNSMNHIIQFQYGDDNMDPIMIEKQKLELIKLDNNELKETYYYDLNDKKDDIYLSLDDQTTKEILKDKSIQNMVEEEYSDLLEYRDNLREKYFCNIVTMDNDFLSPVNLFRLIHNIRFGFKITNSQLSDLNPKYILESNDKLISSFMYYIKEKDAMILLKVLIKSLLSTKKCITEWRFTRHTYDYLLEKLKDKILNSFVQPGEEVGILVAQSYYETLQQSTLNTFHTAGTGHAITSTVVRFSEIINVSKTVKAPQMIVYLKNEYSSTMEMAQYAMSKIIYTKMEDIVKSTSILYGSDENKELLNEKYQFTKIHNEFNNLIKTNDCDKKSKWLLNIEFDKEKLISKNLTMIDISFIINEVLINDNISCIVSDDNSYNLIMQLSIQNQEGVSTLEYINKLEKNIVNINIHGIEGIRSSIINPVKNIVYNLDGSYSFKDERILITEGTNLKDIFLNPMVDSYKTISNDINEILELFGIEAAREFLVQEFNTLLDNEIVYRHHSLLSDLICYSGQFMQIARYGINKSAEYSPFAKASFEEVVDVLVKASVFSESDNMKGVSSNIMIGQKAPIGTNFFDIMLDEEKFMEGISDENKDEDENFDEETLEEEINKIFDNLNDVNDNSFNGEIKIANNKEELKKIEFNDVTFE